MATKNDIQTGIDAAKEDDTKSFDPDDVDARKKRIEKARKLLEEYPPEEPSEATQEEVKAEPSFLGLTPSGTSGAVTRGLGPYAAAAAAGALAGAPFAGVGAIPGAAAGVGALALTDLVGELVVPMANSALGTNLSTPREALNAIFDELGVAKPTSKTEKVIEKFSEMAGSGFAMPVAVEQAAAQVASPVTRRVLSTLAEKPVEQALATGAMGAAGEVSRQQGAGPLQQLGVEFATGALTPAALKSLKVPSDVAPRLIETTKKAISGDKTAKSILAQAAAGTTPEITEATSKLGFEEVPTQFTSISPEYQSIVQRATKAPSSELDIQQQQFLDQLKQKAGEITAKAGGKEDLSSLSNEIKTSMLDKIKKLDDEDDVLYEEIKKLAKPETQTKLNDSLKSVEQRLYRLGGDRGLLSPIERQILDSLSPKPIINEIGEQVGIKYPTIEAIRTLKSTVGKQMRGEKTFPNETIGNAKYYYGKLSDDYTGSITPILEGFGQPELLKNANKLVKQRKGLEQNAINLFGDELSQSISGKITQAGQASAKGNADLIKNILQSTPEQFRPDIVGSAIRNAVTKEGEFNIENFVKWYGGLKKQKESYKALFGNLDPSVSQEMDSLYTISKNVSDSLGAKLRPSESAQITQKSLNIAQKIKNLALSGIIGVATYKTLGAVGIHGGMDAIISSILSGTVARHTFSKSKQEIMGAVDEFLTSKEFADIVAKSKGDPSVFSRMSSQIENTPLYKRFAQKVGPEIAKRALQAPMMPDDQIEQQQPEQ